VLSFHFFLFFLHRFVSQFSIFYENLNYISYIGCCIFVVLQGIDIQQTMVTTFGGDSSQGRTHNLHLQHDVNLKGLRDINSYCNRVMPVAVAVESINKRRSLQRPVSSSSSSSSTNQQRSASRTSTADAGSSSPSVLLQSVPAHPMVKALHDTILSSSLSLKNVDLLIEVERLTVLLGGCRVTFCKSGKDRTGMACTLEQSRQLGERFGCGLSQARTLRDANLMRVHGCRLLIAEKNIGRKVYSINKLQAQFLPVVFRPPKEVCEDIMKKDNS
jgi:hypothetical protein